MPGQAWFAGVCLSFERGCLSVFVGAGQGGLLLLQFFGRARPASRRHALAAARARRAEVFPCDAGEGVARRAWALLMPRRGRIVFWVMVAGEELCPWALRVCVLCMAARRTRR